MGIANGSSMGAKVMEREGIDQARRAFLVKVAYTAPMIATISVLPSIASAGSPAVESGQAPSSTNSQRQRHHNHWHPW
jgi:hypothetical protein